MWFGIVSRVLGVRIPFPKIQEGKGWCSCGLTGLGLDIIISNAVSLTGCSRVMHSIWCLQKKAELRMIGMDESEHFRRSRCSHGRRMG